MRKIIVVLVMLGFIACNGDVLYNHHVKIPDAVWNKNHKVTHLIPIEEPTNAKIDLAVRFIDAIPFGKIKVLLSITSPSKEVRSYEKVVELKKEKDIDKGMAISLDKEETVIDHFTFMETGTYQIDIQQMMNAELLPLIQEVGLVVHKLEKPVQ